MSEEEIIEILEAVKKKDTYWLTTKQFNAMIGLLDLYNKQQEKTKKLELVIKTNPEKMKILADSFNEKVLDTIANNKALDNYISKDKIRKFANALIDSKYWGNDAYIHGKNEEAEEIGKELLELLEEK